MIYYTEQENKVIAALKKNPGASIAVLVGLSGASRPTVRSALMKAEAKRSLISDMQWPRHYTFTTPVEPEEVPTEHVVKPDAVKPIEIGKTWNASKGRIAQVLDSIDLKRMDKGEATSALEQIARAILGLYVALSEIEDGPEWRKEAGVK